MADNNCARRSKRKLIKIICFACGKILYEPNAKKRKPSPKEDEAKEDYIDNTVFTMGTGEMGQLGLGPEAVDIGKPTIVAKLPKDIVQIAAGGLHSVCLTDNGQVFTFGVNDDGALGRATEEESHCTFPAAVRLRVRVTQVSAGDNHTAALDENGRLFIWGAFRDSNGNLGLLEGGPNKSFDPVEVMRDVHVIKVSSGTEHILCLSADERVYSFGNNERGQLGRTLQASISGNNLQPSAAAILKPEQVRFPRAYLRLLNIWTGNYTSFAKSATGEIYAWGLNNYYQLGFGDKDSRLFPEKWPELDEEDLEWMEIASGCHHTLALDSAGRIYSVGRGDYGQLGIGKILTNDEHVRKTMDVIPRLQNVDCVSISCGEHVSFAVSRNGTVFCWGAGSAQLGLCDYEDRDLLFPVPICGNFKTRQVLAVSAGGQHTMVLADEEMSKLLCDAEGHIRRN